MMFFNSPLRRLKRQSAPDKNFTARLRAQLTVDQPMIVYQPLSYMRYAMVSATVALVVILGTGSYAYASPAVSEGTAFYTLKEGLENVEGSLKQGPEAQARFKAKLMHRRIREVSYRLKHDQVPPPALIMSIGQEMHLGIDELKELNAEPDGRTKISTEIHLIMLDHLTNLRAQIILSDIPDQDKEDFLRSVDKRIQTLEHLLPTTP